MMLVTAIAVGLFGTPLALALANLHREEEVVRLERTAAESLEEVPAKFPRFGDRVVIQAHQDGRSIGLYDRKGHRIAGSGPRVGDSIVIAAANGDVRDREVGGQLAVAVPVTRGERIVGSMRSSVSMSVVTDRTRRAVLVMAVIGLVAIAISALVALWQSRRLARPVDRLAEVANRLGDGDFTVRADPSGVPEVDAVGRALDSTAARLDQMLARERSFSEDASHQLRTPLTGLRLTLEAALLDPHADRDATIDAALVEVDRLERTVDDILVLAREEPGHRVANLADVLTRVDGHWRRSALARARPVAFDLEPKLPEVGVSDRALRQILDVLIDNAIRHGGGAISVRARVASGGVVVEVGDAGPRPTGDDDQIFLRRVSEGGGTGIGLALARSLAEADGGRLFLDRTRPTTTFTLALPGVVGI